MKKALAIILISGIFILNGCKGSETKKTMDAAVDEFTGNRAVKQGEKAKEQIGEINKLQEERTENMEKQQKGE